MCWNEKREECVVSMKEGIYKGEENILKGKVI